MTKKALCVGINDYPQRGMDLKGCVNDANNWAALLTGRYDFAKPDVRVVLDKEATHDRVLKELGTLMTGAKSGDVIVFTNSSHGTYLADTNGDEPTYDEAMCPWDTEDHPLVDDELRERFRNVPDGVHLTVISDSCHSGSVTRAPLDTPDDRRVRFMNPRAIGREEIPDIRRLKRKEKFPESGMKETLLTGCRSNQYSYDAVIDGKPAGAFTHHALAAIKAANYKITYRDLHTEVVQSLVDSNFDQEPQLEGRDQNKDRQIFT
jgi:metacaspase-1